MQKRFGVRAGILLLMTLLGTIPIFLSSYPPMADLPQHAAQVALLRNLSNPDFTFSHYFYVNWFTPYLLGYMLVYAFVPIFGIVTACKIVIALVLIATPLATALLLQASGIDIFWAILSIPGLYGFAYQWGLLNFLVAVPLGLLFLYFYMRYTQKPTIVVALGIAAATVFLFFCHALVCAFFLLIAGCYAIAQSRTVKTACVYIGPLLVVLPAAILWLLATRSHPAAKIPMVIGETWRRIFWDLREITGFPSLGMAFIVGSLLFALPFLAGARLTRKPAMWVPALICFLTLLFFPSAIFGTYAVYQRFAILALPCFLMVLQTDTRETMRSRIFKAVTVLLVIGCIVASSRRAMVFNAEVKDFPALLARMQPGQRVLTLVFDREDGVSLAPTLIHFPNWYAALKNGIVDPSFAGYHPELVVFHPGHFPRISIGGRFEWGPGIFRWAEDDGDQYRYFVVRSKTDRGQDMFSRATCPVSLRYHVDEWWLYESACGH